MMINDEIRELISERASFQRIRQVALKTGMVSLFDSAIKKVEAGLTSFEEALAVTLGA
jgi:type II secretory ATPase GspE/PulE/Tfp pilus assembly ATPase PilB-like protein